jgi:glycosyltransferase involved in cell wall biosynthesis
MFIHQSMPGQFQYLAKALADDPGNTVHFLTRHRPTKLAGVKAVQYRLRLRTRGGTHPYLQNLQNGIVHGEAVVNALLELESTTRYRPDIIIVHAGWGEALFLKDIFPDVPVLAYSEFYYRTLGADSFFGPEETPTLSDFMRLKTKNAVNLISLDACDRAITPTHWQHRQHPEAYRDKVSVIHDGVDTTRVRPNRDASFALPDGTVLRYGDEVVTYVNRNLEPFRGLFTFAEAAAIVARTRPSCRFIIIGKESGRYYGPRPSAGSTYQQMATDKLGAAKDRTFFLGALPYDQYLTLLQISAAHVYLTRPFVLSWSMLEAMSAGCLVIASATPPVAEVIVDDETGLLVDFFSPDELAERIAEALERPEQMERIRIAARAKIVNGYAIAECVEAQRRLIAEVMQAAST